MKKLLAKLLVFALFVVMLPSLEADAAVTAISITEAGGGTITSANHATASTAVAGITTVAFTTGLALGNGDAIQVVVNGLDTTTGGGLTNPDIGVASLCGGNATADVSASDADKLDVTFTLTAACAAGAQSFTVAANEMTTDPASNYTMTVVTSLEVGAAIFYVGNANEVQLFGTVEPVLTLAIRNAADDADTNTCDLGTLTTAGVSTCSYRVAVGTNASGGFQVQIEADDALNNAGDTEEISAIAEDGTVTAGTEGYGIAVTGATAGGHDGAGAYDQPVTEDGDFADDDTPVPEAATNFISYADTFVYTQGDTTYSTLVEHKAAISAVTAAGVYTQTDTYTVSATF